MTREEKNHQAYEDVMDRLPARWIEDEEYMYFYRQWRALLPGEEF